MKVTLRKEYVLVPLWTDITKHPSYPKDGKFTSIWYGTAQLKNGQWTIDWERETPDVIFVGEDILSD